ncbi:MATE efflux family protein [Xylaria bambusicola]|uniref:MATE efflux family protein n=1 Tax=Xylaria bambusicola TaxID=326684 RepID=UPI002007281B|nr:MATE efflux family protein [Xylaria bambusicola]KAI0505210.1 MATE efflux family protein [Xylaria bambusicola]
MHTPQPPCEAREEGHICPPTEYTPLLAESSKPTSELHKEDQNAHYDWVAELRLLAQYSLPLIATYLLQYTWSIITTFVAGHLGPDDLAAASMGMTTMAIAGFAIFEGMATALDTLCSQAYGSNNLTGVGVHVQRMLVLMAVVSIPLATIWAASPSILSLFVDQEHVIAKTGAFLRVSILGMPGYASFEALKRFLQAQGNFSIAMVILLICTPVNAFTSWFFAFQLGMGLNGAALGIALTNTLRPLLLILYCLTPFGRWSHKCWGGFSRTVWTNWKPIVKLSFAGSAVNLAEWGSFQIVGFSTSRLGTNHLAAQSVLVTVSMVTWHIPFSMSVGISTRVGHLIGAGLVSTARRAATLYCIVFTVVGCINCFALYFLQHSILSFFLEENNTRVVYELAASTMVVVSLYQIIDAFICWTNGILRGLGRQSVAACVVIAVNYCAAVPLALWLELGPPGFALNGAWLGIASGMVIIAIIECFYIKLLDWDRCVGRVRKTL